MRDTCDRNLARAASCLFCAGVSGFVASRFRLRIRRVDGVRPPVFRGGINGGRPRLDGNKEGLASDMVFDDTTTRTIHVDARYMIWTMDKLDGANNLVNEMGLKPRDRGTAWRNTAGERLIGANPMSGCTTVSHRSGHSGMADCALGACSGSTQHRNPIE